MSEIKPESSTGGASYSDPRAAYSGKVEEFRQAIGMLYIKNNASGRNKFRLKWPDVAVYIFGEQLIDYDNSGVTDRAHRAKLEEEALVRRYELQQILTEFEDKSVKAGALEFAYVGDLIDKLGTSVAKYMYAENIIERVRPGLLAKEKSSRDTKETEEKDAADVKELERAAVLTAHYDEERRVVAQEKEALTNKLEVSAPAESNEGAFVVHIDDDIKPIDVGAQESSVVSADMPKSAEEHFPAEAVVEQSAPAESPIVSPIIAVSEEKPVESIVEVKAEDLPVTENIPDEKPAAPKIHIPGLRLKQDSEKPQEQSPENQPAEQVTLQNEAPKKPEKGMLQTLFSQCAGKRVSSHEVSPQQSQAE